MWETQPMALSAATVSIVRAEDLKERIVQAVKLIGGMGNVVRKGDKVLVKPNLVDGASAETGETADPRAIRTVVELCFAAGASDVLVGEGEVYTGRRARLYDRIRELIEPLGAKVVNFNDEPFPEVDVPNPLFFKKARLAKAMLDCDVYVSLPTLKTHPFGVTVSLKNIYGAIPRKDKVWYHMLDRVEEAIVDLNNIRKPDLTIVDGTYSTLHWGPRKEFPETHRLDLTLAGLDPVAVDVTSAKAIGVQPRTVRYLSWAEEKGLGTAMEDRIETIGLPLSEAYRRSTTTAVEFDNLRNKHIHLVDCGSCTGCYGRIALLVYGTNDEGMKEGLRIQMGPEARPLKAATKVLLCGSCAAPTFYNRLEGTFIPGCPPPLAPLLDTLEALGAEAGRLRTILAARAPREETAEAIAQSSGGLEP